MWFGFLLNVGAIAAENWNLAFRMHEISLCGGMNHRRFKMIIMACVFLSLAFYGRMLFATLRVLFGGAVTTAQKCL